VPERTDSKNNKDKTGQAYESEHDSSRVHIYAPTESYSPLPGLGYKLEALSNGLALGHFVGCNCMAVSRNDARRVPVDLPKCQDEIASVIGRTLPVTRANQAVDLKIVKDGMALIERIRTLYAPRWWAAK
jgi:hypothetical protein